MQYLAWSIIPLRKLQSHETYFDGSTIGAPESSSRSAQKMLSAFCKLGWRSLTSVRHDLTQLKPKCVSGDMKCSPREVACRYVGRLSCWRYFYAGSKIKSSTSTLDVISVLRSTCFIWMISEALRKQSAESQKIGFLNSKTLHIVYMTESRIQRWNRVIADTYRWHLQPRLACIDFSARNISVQHNTLSMVPKAQVSESESIANSEEAATGP